MPRYYCDYCDTYLTHDSPSVRKQHNAGYKHKANVRSYYQQFEEQQTQSLIDQRIKEHLGQAAAFQQQVGASFNQHLISLQANPQRARLPLLPSPIMPYGAPQALLSPPMIPGVRLPLLSRPVTSAPGGYPGAPGALPSMAPPGAVSMPMMLSSLPRPPILTQQNSGVSAAAMYQADPSASLNMIPNNAPATAPQDGFSFSQSSEINH